MKRASGWALRAVTIALGAMMASGRGEAQQLSERVFSAETARVSFEFPVKEDVRVCEHGIHTRGADVRWNGDDRRSQTCSEGTAMAVLRLDDREIVDIDLEPAGTGGVGSYLGAVRGDEAVEFFLMVARTQGSEGADDAVAPAALAEADPVWRDLLGLATDQGLRSEVRTSALFWVGQQAADAVTDGLDEIARKDPESEIRESAVFALSQRDDAESVPILMDLARTSEFGDVRRSALFWLSQSDDRRVPEFFAEILGR